MDYPKSLPDVYLHDGKFTDGTHDGSIQPSRDPAKTQNDIIDSILLVQAWTGELPNEADLTQLARGILAKIEEKESKGLKKSCRVATTGNIVLSGLSSVDGVALVAGDRVLVKAQTAGSENGIYVAAAGAWARATDADDGAEISHGALVPVEEGAGGGNSLWMVATDGTVIIGATSLAFERVGADSLPIGCVLAHSGTVAPPGYLIATGAAVARATYTQLDAVMYVGDAANATAAAWYRCTDPATPSTTRNVAGSYIVLPDYRGLTLRGLDLGRGLDPDAATRVVNSYQTDEFKSHVHTAVQLINGSGSEQIMPQSGTGARTNQTNATGGAETRMKNAAVLWCVKAFSATINQGLIDITALANEVAGKVPLSAFTGDNQVLAPTGRQKIPGGLLLQWGGYSGAQVSSLTVTFPLAFAEVYRVYPVDGAAANAISYSSAPTNTGFVVSAAGGTGDFSWFAIGKAA